MVNVREDTKKAEKMQKRQIYFFWDPSTTGHEFWIPGYAIALRRYMQSFIETDKKQVFMESSTENFIRKSNYKLCIINSIGVSLSLFQEVQRRSSQGLFLQGKQKVVVEAVSLHSPLSGRRQCCEGGVMGVHNQMKSMVWLAKLVNNV